MCGVTVVVTFTDEAAILGCKYESNQRINERKLPGDMKNVLRSRLSAFSNKLAGHVHHTANRGHGPSIAEDSERRGRREMRSNSDSPSKKSRGSKGISRFY
jgi:hypothetical protein